MERASLPSIAVMAAGRGPTEAELALAELLAQPLPGASLHLCSDHKVDTRKRARLLNLEANHPPQTLQLRNLALLAEAGGAAGYHRDAFAWAGLEALLEQLSGVDLLVLLGQAWVPSEEEWRWIRSGGHSGRLPFLRAGRACARDSFIFDLRAPMGRTLISTMARLYASGALLALENPLPAHVLRQLAAVGHAA